MIPQYVFFIILIFFVISEHVSAVLILVNIRKEDVVDGHTGLDNNLDHVQDAF